MMAFRYIPKDHLKDIDFPDSTPKGLEPGNKCSIALSGGIDSQFLLHSLTKHTIEQYAIDFEGICCDFVDSRGEPESIQAQIIAENYDIKFK